MALHLNDNGITRSIPFFIEVLNVFDLKLDDVSWRRIETMVDEQFFKDPLTRKYYEKEQPQYVYVKSKR